MMKKKMTQENVGPPKMVTPSWSKDSVFESEQSKKRSSSSPRPSKDGNSIKSKSKSPTWSKGSESK